MIYAENGSLLLNPDVLPLSMFGVIAEGDFDPDGVPTGWKIEVELDESLPRWLEPQSVLFISCHGPDVYVRGMHSTRLTAKRAKAMIRDRPAVSEDDKHG